MSKTDRIKIEEITKDKIADNLLQGERVYCLYPFYNSINDYGIIRKNLLTQPMEESAKMINREGARFFVVKVSPSYIDEKEGKNNEWGTRARASNTMGGVYGKWIPLLKVVVSHS